MSRSYRLFDLLQVLRRHRTTVSGRELAREVGVSLRTIRRDIATLQTMGADIDGEAGVGYILRPGFLLPPLSFTEDELQALVAGAKWVSGQTDDALTLAAKNALAKIGAVLPPEMSNALDDDALYVGGTRKSAVGIDLARIRRAMRDQLKVHILYSNENGQALERTIWPIMLGFVDSRRFIAGWCELRSDFRLFRADRILEIHFLNDQYPGSRRRLVKEWRAQEESRPKRTMNEKGV